MDAKGQDIDGAYRVPWASGFTTRAAINPAVSAPLPAYGTRLRGIGFVDSDGSSRLVIKLLDNLSRASGAYLLRLHSTNALGGVVERLTDVAGRARKCLSYLPCRLMAQIADTSLRLIQHPVFAALQPLVAPRTLYLACLGLLETSKLLITVLNCRLGRASADEENLAPIGGGYERVHAQVHTDHGLLGPRLVRYFADEAHDSV